MDDGFSSACKSLNNLSPDYFHLFLLIIRRDQEDPNCKLKLESNTYGALAAACSRAFESIRNSSSVTVIPLQSLDIIFDILSRAMGEIIDQQRTPIGRYISAIEGQHQINPEMNIVFRSIQQQLFVHVALVDPSSLDSTIEPQKHAPFSLLSALINSELWGPTDADLEDLLFIMRPFGARYELLLAIVFPAFRTTPTYNVEIQSSKDIMNFITKFKAILANLSQKSPQDRMCTLKYFGDIMSNTKEYRPQLISEIDAEYGDELVRIEDPTLAAIISCQISPKRAFPTLIDPFTSKWEDRFGEEIFDVIDSTYIDIHHHPRSMITFIRICLGRDGSPLRVSAINFLCGDMKFFEFSEEEVSYWFHEINASKSFIVERNDFGYTWWDSQALCAGFRQEPVSQFGTHSSI
jgi:hypothetical protein